MKTEKLEYCYHTHTTRCGHALGKEEEYIKQAIKCGIKRIGFADHVFLPTIVQDGMRGRYSELGDYVNTLRELKEAYKDKIDLKIGFECEFYPSFVYYYKDLLNSKTVDYLILGQHLHESINGIEGYHYRSDTYAEDVVNGIKSGLFTYLCHPDLCMLWSKWNANTENDFRKIFKACEETHTPIEINVGGLRGNREYPCDEAFELSKHYNLEYVIGIDAHRPEDFNKKDINKAFRFAKKHKLKIKDLVI